MKVSSSQAQLFMKEDAPYLQILKRILVLNKIKYHLEDRNTDNEKCAEYDTVETLLKGNRMFSVKEKIFSIKNESVYEVLRLKTVKIECNKSFHDLI